MVRKGSLLLVCAGVPAGADFLGLRGPPAAVGNSWGFSWKSVSDGPHVENTMHTWEKSGDGFFNHKDIDKVTHKTWDEDQFGFVHQGLQRNTHKDVQDSTGHVQVDKAIDCLDGDCNKVITRDVVNQYGRNIENKNINCQDGDCSKTITKIMVPPMDAVMAPIDVMMSMPLAEIGASPVDAFRNAPPNPMLSQLLGSGPGLIIDARPPPPPPPPMAEFLPPMGMITVHDNSEPQVFGFLRGTRLNSKQVYGHRTNMVEAVFADKRCLNALLVMATSISFVLALTMRVFKASEIRTILNPLAEPLASVPIEPNVPKTVPIVAASVVPVDDKVTEATHAAKFFLQDVYANAQTLVEETERDSIQYYLCDVYARSV